MGFIETFFKNTKDVKAKDILSFISLKIEARAQIKFHHAHTSAFNVNMTDNTRRVVSQLCVKGL